MLCLTMLFLLIMCGKRKSTQKVKLFLNKTFINCLFFTNLPLPHSKLHPSKAMSSDPQKVTKSWILGKYNNNESFDHD